MKTTGIPTESINKNTWNISESSTEEIVRLINQEDAKVAEVVKGCLQQIAELVELLCEKMKKGGRIFYCGAGTSGRLAIADAAECPPTYGVDKGNVVAIIAGGISAVLDASEGEEDNAEKGREVILAYRPGKNDTVIGVSAAGRAPFVLACMRAAKEQGSTVAAIVNNENTPMADIADLSVTALTGAEVVKGSTRMKAGTAQKMILNMISTAVFIKLGYVYHNFMVNMKVSNHKLEQRAVSTVSVLLGIDEKRAEAELKNNHWSVRAVLEQNQKKE